MIVILADQEQYEPPSPDLVIICAHGDFYWVEKWLADSLLEKQTEMNNLLEEFYSIKIDFDSRLHGWNSKNSFLTA
jgi:hypothetical protein